MVFEVWNGTSAMLYQSGVKTGTAGASAVNVLLADVSVLRSGGAQSVASSSPASVPSARQFSRIEMNAFGPPP